MAVLAYAGVAVAGPTGGEVVGGSGTITQSGPATDINQASQRLDIDWQTFSTGVNESVNFYQPGASAVAINRVIGGVPSQLRGALTANGRVFILNQAGVTFYGTSRVNVGALLATTAANVSVDGDSFSFSGNGYGRVVNQGNIKVSDGGFAILAAPYVANAGVIEANLGEVRLVSANAYTLDLRGDGLITFTVDADTLDEIAAEGDALGVDNTGVVRARSGLVAITAETASKIVSSVVNLDGVVDASAFGAGKDGGTVLVASTGDVNITGELRADGGVDGNGGRIITKADGTNAVAETATLSARGGDAAGDGGFIEVSGTHFRLGGTIDASAPNGAGGSFLLDPENVTIKDGSGFGGGTDTWFETDIESQSQGGTDVHILAWNSIVMEDLADNELTGGDGDITLQTAPETTGDASSITNSGVGTITFEDLNDTIVTQRGDITIEASGSNADITVGNLRTGVPLGSGATLVANPGSIEVIAHGANGDIANVGDIEITAKSTWGGSAMAMAYLEAGGDITVNGDTLVTASGGAAAAAVGMFAGAEGGSEGQGDLSFNGEFTVLANATATATGEGFDALAFAGGFMQAAGDVTVVTPSSTMRVQATATNGIENGGGASATAGLIVRAGNVGVPTVGTAEIFDDAFNGTLVDTPSLIGGNISITGNTVVTADATVTVGAQDIGSDTRGFSSNIAGDASAMAGVLLDAHSGSSPEVDAAGNVTVTGNVTVDGNANITVGDLAVHDVSLDSSNFTAFSGQVAGDANADATFLIDADGGATINSDVTVTADAHVTVGNIAVTNISAFAGSDEEASFIGFDSNVVGGASANAEFDVAAGGAVNIGVAGGGQVQIGADATIGIGNITVSGIATASSGSATAAVTAFREHVANSAQADAGFDISSAGGAVTVGDAIAIDANASLSVGDVSVDGRARAWDSASSSRSYYDGGASASFVGFDNALAQGAEADATLTIDDAGGDVSLTGGVTVGADAALSVGNIAIDGSANASAFSSGTANAFFAGFNEDVFDDGADASAYVVSSDNMGAVTIAGGLSVDATAASNAGDIAITGIADATTWGDDGYSTSARASFYGVYGDVFGGRADADASAYLSYNNGVSVSGDIALGATTDIAVGNVDITGSAKAIASGSENSANANASFTGIGDDILESGDAYAYLDVNSTNGDVTLDGVSATADTEITVGAIAIRGGRMIPTKGEEVGSSFVPGGAIARASGESANAHADFKGIDDDVMDSGWGSAFVNIYNTRGSVTVDGDVAINGSLDIAIGAITIDGVASAAASGLAYSSAGARAHFEGIGNSVVDGEASAEASFYISDTSGTEEAAGDVVINGDVTVNAQAVAGIGDINIDATVRADATGDYANASFTGIDSEVFDDEAYAYANFSVYNTKDDLRVSGDIAVTATGKMVVGDIGVNADVNASALSSNANAYAYFTGFEEEFFDSEASASASFYASNTGGDVVLGGDVLVRADARIAAGDITITGTAQSLAENSGSAYANLEVFEEEFVDSEASAEAYMGIYNTAGDVAITGDVTIEADGTIEVGNIAIDGAAIAEAGVFANANAGFTGFGSELVDDSAYAYADLSIGSAASVTVGGDIVVGGDATVTVGDVSITGLANALASALFVDPYAQAGFYGIDRSLVDGAYGDAYVDIWGVDGDVTLGGVAVRGDGDVSVGAITVAGTAMAAMNGSSGRATAVFAGIHDYVMDEGASAYASVEIGGVGGSVAFNGGVTVDGNATVTVGGVDATGSAFASGLSGSADASVLAFGGDLADRAYVYANFEASADEDVTNVGGIGVNADATVTVGDIAINGTANTAGTEGFASAWFGADLGNLADGAYASASLWIEAGHDVGITGDVASRANADVNVGGISIAVGGNAAGDPIVPYAYGNAGAEAYLGIFAGGEGEGYRYRGIFSVEGEGSSVDSMGSGSVDIAGNVNVDAFATFSGPAALTGYRPAYAYASGEIRAANDVTIGPRPENLLDGNEVAARAIADTDGSYASANAYLEVEAGRAVGSDGYGGGIGLAMMLYPGGSDGYGGDGGEIVLTEGNLSITGDILSFASANAAAPMMDGGDEKTLFSKYGFHEGEGLSANANLALKAHGTPPENGNLTNEYYTHEPQAIARVNGGTEAFVNATQSDLDTTVAEDEDGSPFTYWDEDWGSDEIGYNWAEIVVHWHGEGKIFQMPRGGPGEGIDPYILIKDRPVPPNTGNAITTAGALALLPGGASCNFGAGGFTVDADGSVVFGQFVIGINPGDLDLAACDDNVRYPIFTDQTL